uniref:F-box protein Hrt3/FBXO9 C-terminal domain-containing protein n=1 Tax=Lotharella globosa TaxID=91324 RepID=A0A7S4DZT9_9EUKA|mmetsp:Transcript_15525/g.29271  ORF Transcript_15525/g.29271 Transcript_15525/m.29271 type:complete len:221 (+) Transcript_15525:14-676(+)
MDGPCIEDYLLDPELYVEIFKFLPGVEVAGNLRLVSTMWKERAADEILWRLVCSPKWPRLSRKGTLRRFKSWKEMFFRRPHVRFDGVYVLEKTYWKTCTVGDHMSLERETVKCSYYRYLRFFPNGEVAYALLNQEPKRALDWIHKGHRSMCVGRYKVKKKEVEVQVDVGYMMLYMKLKLLKRELFSRLKILRLEGLDKGEVTPFPVGMEPFYLYRVHRMK